MNTTAWQLHLENTRLRRKIARLRTALEREHRRAETWRCRALGKKR